MLTGLKKRWRAYSKLLIVGCLVCTPAILEVQTTPAWAQSVCNAGNISLPLNTHVHPNWVFTEPGTYQLAIRQTIPTAQGERAVTDTLTFLVGGAGNANDGHFDFGADGTRALIRDDRAGANNWGTPADFTFGLGDAAIATLPAGLEDLAPAGTQVWMIGNTQQQQVPWLGANTQHPELLTQATGPVTWELVGVTTPSDTAQVMVFVPGNFGQLIGQVWFGPTTACGSMTATPAVADFERQADLPELELPSIVVAEEQASAAPETAQVVASTAAPANATAGDTAAAAPAVYQPVAAPAARQTSTQKRLAETGVPAAVIPVLVLAVGILILGIAVRLPSSRSKQ